MNRGGFLWISEWVALDASGQSLNEWYLEPEKYLDAGAANNLRLDGEIQVVQAGTVDATYETSNNPEPNTPYTGGSNWATMGSDTALGRGINVVTQRFDGSSLKTFVRIRLTNQVAQACNVRIRIWVSLSE